PIALGIYASDVCPRCSAAHPLTKTRLRLASGKGTLRRRARRGRTSFAQPARPQRIAPEPSMQNLRIACAALGVASFLIAAPALAQGASGPVKVGLMLPYSGTYAALGNAIEN